MRDHGCQFNPWRRGNTPWRDVTVGKRIAWGMGRMMRDTHAMLCGSRERCVARTLQQCVSSTLPRIELAIFDVNRSALSHKVDEDEQASFTLPFGNYAVEPSEWACTHSYFITCL